MAPNLRTILYQPLNSDQATLHWRRSSSARHNLAARPHSDGVVGGTLAALTIATLARVLAVALDAAVPLHEHRQAQ